MVLLVIARLMMIIGVALYQYVVLVISLPIPKKLSMSRKVALTAMFASASFMVYSISIGMPSALNIAPTTYLSTITMAGPVINLVRIVLSVAFIVGYLIFLSKRLKTGGKGFVIYKGNPKNDKDGVPLPSAWEGHLCAMATIGLSLLSQWFDITTIQATTYAQVLFIALLFLLMGRKRLAYPSRTCIRGTQGSLTPVVFISIVMGYGTVVQVVPVFGRLVEQALSLDVNPYLFTSVAINLLVGITADGASGVILLTENFGATTLGNLAINVGALHCIAVIFDAGFGSLSYSGAITSQLSVLKFSYKDGYFQQFMINALINLLVGLLVMLMTVVLL